MILLRIKKMFCGILRNSSDHWKFCRSWAVAGILANSSQDLNTVCLNLLGFWGIHEGFSRIQCGEKKTVTGVYI